MTRTRILAVTLGALLAFAACGSDDKKEEETTTTPPSESSEPVGDTTSFTVASTIPATTDALPPWDGDPEAAVGALQSHLDGVHSSADYYAAITGVSVDPGTGLGIIETSLDDQESDLGIALCGDAAMVAWGDPAGLTGLNVIDVNGNLLASGTPASACGA